MYGIRKKRKGLKVTEQRLCEKARMIRINTWLTKLEMIFIQKSIVSVNTDKTDQNIGSDDDG